MSQLAIPRCLDEWLVHIERVHSRPIDLGLRRVERVKTALGIAQRAPVVTVGGTNGKGSTCAMIERILRCAGYRTCLYTSPHLLRYNERVSVAGVPVDDVTLCRAFEEVEAARGDTPLTYFEFGTLAAWQIFAASRPDVLILEVGLGGRLDAVNCFDCDCAVITSVDVDHTEFLGSDRESIGFEKAGIFRPGKPAIVSDPNPPRSVVDHARRLAADLRLIGKDFGFTSERHQWQYWERTGERIQRRGGLAHPGLRGAEQLHNAAAAIAAVGALQAAAPVSMQDIRRGLLEVEWPGRFQVLPGRPIVVLDVAHNPQAAGMLAGNLGNMGYHPETWAVFGILSDKDVAGVIERIGARIDHWLLTSLPGPRGTSAENLRQALARGGIRDAACFETPAAAYAFARDHASEDDRIVVFGSFLTVAEVMRVLA